MKTKNIIFTLLLVFSSCGKENHGKKVRSENISESLKEEMTGTFRAQLIPVNKRLTAKLNGSLTLVKEKDKDEFVADVRLSHGPISVIHPQNIHIGTRCPTIADDKNQDGIIDAEEGFAVFKEILIPLDDDLSSQRFGLGIFPVTNEFGEYVWSRVTSFEKLTDDLLEKDINLKDDYLKWKSLPINMAGRVVIVKGISEETELPPTVKRRGRESIWSSLPIACGIIKKIEMTPGVIDNDVTSIQIPTPDDMQGPMEDDGAIFTTEETTDDYGDDEN